MSKWYFYICDHRANFTLRLAAISTTAWISIKQRFSKARYLKISIPQQKKKSRLKDGAKKRSWILQEGEKTIGELAPSLSKGVLLRGPNNVGRIFVFNSVKENLEGICIDHRSIPRKIPATSEVPIAPAIFGPKACMRR